MMLDGHSAASVASRLGLSGTNILYRWKSKFGGMEVSEAMRLTRSGRSWGSPLVISSRILRTIRSEDSTDCSRAIPISERSRYRLER
mgnify:CR=1 FL=1